jgi:lipoprotein-anchoring transpeptidase ErfK/SrfK
MPAVLKIRSARARSISVRRSTASTVERARDHRQAVSSGCFRMTNEDVIDLYSRVRLGTKVVVM